VVAVVLTTRSPWSLCWLQYCVNPALVALADLITSPAWALGASIVTASAAIVIRFFLTLDFALLIGK